MENQHRKIKGYRELSQAEIDQMNETKELGVKMGALVDDLTSHQRPAPDSVPDQRWVSIGRTHFQEGLMALTRSIAKPGFF